jgi:hypothetical protein
MAVLSSIKFTPLQSFLIGASSITVDELLSFYHIDLHEQQHGSCCQWARLICRNHRWQRYFLQQPLTSSLHEKNDCAGLAILVQLRIRQGRI